MDAQTLADQLGVSRSLLDLRLRQINRTTAAKLLRTERLNAVKRRLRDEKSALADLFRRCGFSNVRAAENLFKRLTGTSASAWRRQHANRISPAIRGS